MWRYLAGGAAALLMVAVGVLIFNARARSDTGVAVQPLAAAPPPQAAGPADEPLPDSVPEATERTREQKRFDRYDKDRDGTVTREEYLAQRRKTYAKLDLNHDGVLQFDEWSAKIQGKFAHADRDHSNGMNPAEFASTAVKRKPPRRANCAPVRASAPVTDEE